MKIRPRVSPTKRFGINLLTLFVSWTIVLMWSIFFLVGKRYNFKKRESTLAPKKFFEIDSLKLQNVCMKFYKPFQLCPFYYMKI